MLEIPVVQEYLELPSEVFVAPHLYVIETESTRSTPGNKQFMVVSPLTGGMAKVTETGLRLLATIAKVGKVPKIPGAREVVDLLLRCQILSHFPVKIPKQAPPRIPFWSTHLTLFPTFACNLHCKYCYAQSAATGLDMPLELAKAGIDFIVESAITHPEVGDEVGLGHLGGGEPLLARVIPNMRIWIDYFRKSASQNNLKCEVGTVTNGCLSENVRQFMLDTFDHVQVSIDGPEDMQNAQRPLSGGGPSFREVMRTIEALERIKKSNYSIRSTITAFNVKRMAEMVSFFASISSVDTFFFEPLTYSGRTEGPSGCLETQAPTPAEFTAAFIEAMDTAKSLGRHISYSGCRASLRPTTRFCGAAGDNFVLTPAGDVTACDEVSRPEELGADIFIIGRFDTQHNRFVFFEDRIRNLNRRVSGNIKGCASCFLEYQCAGWCLAKTYRESRNIFDTTRNKVCSANQEITAHMIEQRLAASEIVQISAQ